MKKIIFGLLLLAACQSSPSPTIPVGTLTSALPSYQMGLGFSTYDSAFASTLTPVKVQAHDLYLGTTISIDGVIFYGKYKFYKISNKVVQINNNGTIVSVK